MHVNITSSTKWKVIQELDIQACRGKERQWGVVGPWAAGSMMRMNRFMNLHRYWNTDKVYVCKVSSLQVEHSESSSEILAKTHIYSESVWIHSDLVSGTTWNKWRCFESKVEWKTYYIIFPPQSNLLLKVCRTDAIGAKWCKNRKKISLFLEK